MQREIGSNFWLNPYETLKEYPIGSPEQFSCQGKDYSWLSTGRSAIRLVIRDIEAKRPSIKKIAVLPSFTCDTVFEPFLKAGYDVYYYSVDEWLRTTSDSILKTVYEHDASIVLFHRFFGFDTLDGQVDKMCEYLRQSGKYSIEDCTQCLYSDIGRAEADYTIGSIRKWTGTPDGGFAVCRDGLFTQKPYQTDKVLEAAKVKASYAKYHYLFEQQGEKDNMLAMFRQAEDILDQQTDFFAISETSSKVQSNLNFLDLKIKRRANYSILLNNIHAPIKTLFSVRNEGNVPLYFPLYVENRLSLQKHLVQNAIYAPVVWPKSDLQPRVCAEAENAYEHLLCIPIDQRYDEDDMFRIVDVINKYYCQ